MTDQQSTGFSEVQIATQNIHPTGDNPINSNESNQDKKNKFGFLPQLPKLITLTVLILTLFTVYIALNLHSKKNEDQGLKNKPVELVEEKFKPTPQTQNEYQKSVAEFSNQFNSLEPFKEKLKPPTVNLNIEF